MSEDLRVHAAAWIAADPDERDRAELTRLLEVGDDDELARRFSAPLSFGTAGLRGPVTRGPVGHEPTDRAPRDPGRRGLAGRDGRDAARGVVVGRDARHGSEDFNDEVVAVLWARASWSTRCRGRCRRPFVPYAVKALGAAAGIMITASHNPPQDNGYKLYAGDGSQIIPPADEIVERHADAAGTPALGRRGDARHHVIGEDLLGAYRDHFVRRFARRRATSTVAYTPLYGVGGAPMTALFEAAGFSRVTVVDAQFAPDAAFPGLPFPNPEEPGVLDVAISTAERTGADLVIANDPDADRLGVAVRDARILARAARRRDRMAARVVALVVGARPGDVVATTIVSSSLLEAMARDAGVAYATTLTGFKWISRAAGDGVLRFGYEEALGFAVDPCVADKDGMSAALCLARLAHDLRVEGKTLLTRLDEIESRFGVHAGAQLSVRAVGEGGLGMIAAVMARLRAAPPASLGGLAVVEVDDLSRGWRGLPPTEGLDLAPRRRRSRRRAPLGDRAQAQGVPRGRRAGGRGPGGRPRPGRGAPGGPARRRRAPDAPRGAGADHSLNEVEVSRDGSR